MKQRTFGCTGTRLSEFCLGTMNFGWRIGEPTSFAILDAYRAAGGSFIQALAPTPGFDDGPASVAASEAVVGRWWRARGLRRAGLFLATRVNLRPGDELPEAARADQLRRTIEGSLARFQTDYLDLLVCEWPSSETTGPALRSEIDQFVRRGGVRYVAFAGLPGWQVANAIRDGAEANHSRIDALQADYSLLARVRFETELAGACDRHRLGFIARSPLAGGLLAQREGSSLALGTSRLRWLVERYGLDCGAKVVRTVNQLAHTHHRTPAQIALAWVLHSPHVTSVLIGANSAALLRDLVAAGEVDLAPSDLETLDRAATVQRLHVPLRAATTPPDRISFREPSAGVRAPELVTT